MGRWRATGLKINLLHNFAYDVFQLLVQPLGRLVPDYRMGPRLNKNILQTVVLVDEHPDGMVD